MVEGSKDRAGEWFVPFIRFTCLSKGDRSPLFALHWDGPRLYGDRGHVS